MSAHTPTAKQDTNIDIVILAAGSANRFRQNKAMQAKQFYPIAGLPVYIYCLQSFLRWPKSGHIIFVCPEHSDLSERHTLTENYIGEDIEKISFIHGGDSRAQSALYGLEALDDMNSQNRWVAIHDSARPFVPVQILDTMLDALQSGAEAVVPVLPIADTIRQINADGNTTTLDRDNLRKIQTPQGFDRKLIYHLHSQQPEKDKKNLNDDAMLVEQHGHNIHLIDGDERLKKITYMQDLDLIQQANIPFETRSASGFDVHKFSDERADTIMICGVAVDHDKGIIAHSDGDVAFHALCDALFATIGDGDIGMHFPPSDPQWRNASSDIFLRYAIDAVKKTGAIINNLDITIICETPKIAPYQEQMKSVLSAITNLTKDRLSIKATTSETLGFTGRKEGIAAFAQATIKLPINKG